MIKLFSFCVFMCCVCTTTIAQNCQITLKGKVTDFHDNSSIIGASLHIENSNKYVTTDFDGLFEFKNLCEGKITITVKHLACETKTISINLTKDIFKDISLEHHIEDLEEVIVASTHKTTSNTVQATKIDSKVIEDYSGKSLGDALKEVSGISSINTGHTIVKPIINGLHSSRIAILTNGVRLQDHDWGVEHAPSIDLNSAGNITVYKGANALEYSGDAIGGVVVIKSINIILKDTLFGKTQTAMEFSFPNSQSLSI